MTALTVAIAALVLACLVIGAVKRFTFAKILRIMAWAWRHPWQALSSRYPEDGPNDD